MSSDFRLRPLFKIVNPVYPYFYVNDITGSRCFVAGRESEGTAEIIAKPSMESSANSSSVIC